MSLFERKQEGLAQAVPMPSGNPDATCSEGYCYSADGEEFHDTFATREDAAEEGFTVHDDLDVICTGEVVNAYDFLGASFVGMDVIEIIDQMLYESVNAEEPVLEATAAQREELGNVIIEWLRANVSPNRWGVENVREHKRDEGPAPSAQENTPIPEPSVPAESQKTEVE